MFIGSGVNVYNGMVIGRHIRNQDLEVNPTKGKQLSNVRASGSDENIILAPPQEMPLDLALEYIGPDELVEITPKNIRIRKLHLNPHERKRYLKKED